MAWWEKRYSAITGSQIQTQSTSGTPWWQNRLNYAQTIKPTSPVVQPIQQPVQQLQPVVQQQTQPVKPLFNFSNTLKDVQTRISSFLDSFDDPQRRAAADKRGQDLISNMQKGFVELAQNSFKNLDKINRPYKYNPPTAEQQQKVKEFSQKSPKGVTAFSELKSGFEGAKEMLPQVARAIPQAGMRTALTITGKKEYTPGTKAEEFVYGKEPLKDIAGLGEETIMGFGGNKDLAVKWGLPLGAVLTTLDLYPGTPKGKIASTIAKISDEKALVKILKTDVFKDITDDVAESLAHRLAPLKSVDEVEAELNMFTKNGFQVEDVTKGLEGGGGIREQVANWPRVQGQTKGLSEAGKQMTVDAELSRRLVANEKDYQYLLKRAGASPEEIAKGKITVYRATENGKILPGDFVTPNKDALKPYFDQRIETGRNPKVVSQIVDIKDLRIGDEPTDFVFSPKSGLEGGVKEATQKGLQVEDLLAGKTPGKAQVLETPPPVKTAQTEGKLTKDEIVSPTQDIRTSSTAYKETPQVARAVEETAKQVKDPPSTVRKVISALSETKTKVVEYVQNEQERVRKLVGRKDVKVDDISDPYLKATLYPGRVAEKVSQGKQEAEEIIKQSKKLADETKADLATVRKEVNDYLYYRHAPERNAALGEKAAGITTEEAEAGLKALEASPRGAKIKELADRASKLNEQTLDLLKNAGVITEELYNTLRTKYKNHVPLNRIFEETEDIGSILSGKGFNVRSTGIQTAKGSEREVDDILGNILTNYEQSVLRSEKNIVDQATLAFARQNKDILGDLFEISHPQAIGTDFAGKPLMEKTTDPTILQMFENGKRTWIKINDKNLAVALQGVGKEKIGTLLKPIATFTRLYSGLATRFNPEFALPNKLRDLQETAIYLSSQKGVGFGGAVKMAARDLRQQNTVAVLDFLRGKDSEGARLYKELKELGGTTGGFGLSTKEQTKLSLESLEKLANSKTRRIADNLVGYIDGWNTIFEDSTRLSVYRQALKQGLSKERAAFLAKEASINFNRMGKGGPIINALWMFSNASIQGTTKMIRALKNPKVLGATVLTVGGSVAAVNQWNDNLDPEWRDKVTKWDRLNGLPVVLPNSSGEGVKYITIPVSWGIKPIKVMSDYAYDSVSGKGEFNVKEFMGNTLTSILEAYNPAGGSDIWSALMPTAGDIPLEMLRNQSWSGAKIRPDFDKNAPADVQYFSSLDDTKTGKVAISISEILQSKAGISISPADIKYAFDGYVGGIGRAGSKTVNTITGALGGKPAPIDEYPMVSRFYRERTQEELRQGTKGQTEDIKKILGEQSRERFKLKEEAEKISEELTTLSKEEKTKRAKEIYSKNPQLYKKLKEIKEEKALGLTYTERMVKQLGVENGERAKYILSQYNQLKTKEEKTAYLKDLYKKKVLTTKVFEQLKYLKNK